MRVSIIINGVALLGGAGINTCSFRHVFVGALIEFALVTQLLQDELVDRVPHLRLHFLRLLRQQCQHAVRGRGLRG